MENNKSFLELKWGYFFDLMDYDKNGRWDLRDFVSFSEKLYILYEVNHIELDVFQFMKKSRNIFNRLLSEVTKELRYIKKEDWISFLHKTEEYSGLNIPLIIIVITFWNIAA